MTMNYENAPATRLLATHCALCGRALVDADSITRGIGPICADKYGADVATADADWSRVLVLTDGIVSVDEIDSWGGSARKGANTITHMIAARQDAEEVPMLVDAIHALGYGKLANRLADRLVKKCPAVIVEEGQRNGRDVYVVRTENLTDVMFRAQLAGFRAIRGRWFEGETKSNIVPVTAKRVLWETMQRTLRGAVLRSPKGETTITA